MSFIVRTLLHMLAVLPRRLLQAMGRLAGRLHWLVGTRASKVTAANLELCRPAQAGELALPSLMATGQSVFETPAIWLGRSERIDRWIDKIHGEALLTEKLAEPAGLLILLPHIGNWELFNVFYRRYGTMTALYQPPRPLFMRSVMAEVRARHGNRMVPTTRTGIKALFRALTDGETVVVLPDQVPANGTFVPFFGHAALTDDLTGRLLHRTQASALSVSMIRRTDGRFDVYIAEPPEAIYKGGIDATAAVNKLVEQAVELAPAQYQWEYKRFRERPSGDLKIYRFGKPTRYHGD